MNDQQPPDADPDSADGQLTASDLIFIIGALRRDIGRIEADPLSEQSLANDRRKTLRKVMDMPW